MQLELNRLRTHIYTCIYPKKFFYEVTLKRFIYFCEAFFIEFYKFTMSGNISRGSFISLVLFLSFYYFRKIKQLFKSLWTLLSPCNLIVKLAGDHGINLFWPLTGGLYTNFYPSLHFLPLIIKSCPYFPNN